MVSRIPNFCIWFANVSVVLTINYKQANKQTRIFQIGCEFGTGNS